MTFNFTWNSIIKTFNQQFKLLNKKENSNINMGANQSDLSNAHYGYDFVVATTQESINATMKEYLYNTGFPVVRVYLNQDSDGNPVPVSYEDLMKQTNGTDPLKVAG